MVPHILHRSSAVISPLSALSIPIPPSLPFPGIKLFRLHSLTNQIDFVLPCPLLTTPNPNSFCVLLSPAPLVLSSLNLHPLVVSSALSLNHSRSNIYLSPRSSVFCSLPFPSSPCSPSHLIAPFVVSSPFIHSPVNHRLLFLLLPCSVTFHPLSFILIVQVLCCPVCFSLPSLIAHKLPLVVPPPSLLYAPLPYLS